MNSIEIQMLKLMLISKYISIFLFSEPLNYSLLLIENNEEGQGESIDYLLNDESLKKIRCLKYLLMLTCLCEDPQQWVS